MLERGGRRVRAQPGLACGLMSATVGTEPARSRGGRSAPAAELTTPVRITEDIPVPMARNRQVGSRVSPVADRAGAAGPGHGVGKPWPGRWSQALACAAWLGLATAAHASAPHDGGFVTSDGVRLHTLEAGPDDRAAGAGVIVLIPGWTMPAWIWDRQIAALSAHHRVVALDPRGQGESDLPEFGYDQDRRGHDIAELIATLGPRPVLLVGWSLGVLDSLAYVHRSGDDRLAGLVLVDNSVGEPPAPVPRRGTGRRARPTERAEWMARFVRSMFRQPLEEAVLDRLTEAALRTPPDAAASLLRYDVPREYWRDAVLSVRRPVLYAVTPRLAGQARSLEADDPLARAVVFPGAGHALFVDDAARFNAMVDEFMTQQVWPAGGGR